MMKEFDFGGYVRINHRDSIGTLGIVNTFDVDLSGFRYALSELLAHYDKLACSIHNNSAVRESLAHLYASLNAFRIELITIGYKKDLIDIVTTESASIFANLMMYKDGSKFESSEIWRNI